MTEQELLNYSRIAEAIEYIHENFKNQPSLDQIAKKLNLSPFHFQRMFSDWAGTSPKKFLQYTSLNYAKSLLKEKQKTLFDTSLEIGYSSTSRLHDLFISIEGMSPAEFKNGGGNIRIDYNFHNTNFGKIIAASTDKGICKLTFIEDEKIALLELQNDFPNATLNKQTNDFQLNAIRFFNKEHSQLSELKLHLRGSAFQLKIWESLLKIPFGELTTYGKIANDIEIPTASRAVGTAIGKNPVAFLIPCHRIIQSSGNLGGYMWGKTRKSMIIGWEASIKNEH